MTGYLFRSIRTWRACRFDSEHWPVRLRGGEGGEAGGTKSSHGLITTRYMFEMETLPKYRAFRESVEAFYWLNTPAH